MDWRETLEAELRKDSGFEPRCLHPGDRYNPPEYEDLPGDLEGQLMRAEALVDEIAGHVTALKSLTGFCWADDKSPLWEILNGAAEELKERRSQGKEPPLLDQHSMQALGLPRVAAEA